MASQAISLSGTIQNANSEALIANVAAAALGQGLKVGTPAPGTLTLSRRFLPPVLIAFGVGWIVLGVVLGSYLDAGPLIWLFVLIGALLLVFARVSESVSLVVTSQPDGAHVVATGKASGKLSDFVGGLF